MHEIGCFGGDEDVFTIGVYEHAFGLLARVVARLDLSGRDVYGRRRGGLLVRDVKALAIERKGEGLRRRDIAQTLDDLPAGDVVDADHVVVGTGDIELRPVGR